MPLPVRSLPVLQNFDCHGCTDCCREYRVPVTDAERQRISALEWGDEPALEGVPLFAREGGWFSKRYRLNQRADGTCVFLDANGGCRIHARHGPEAKPLACRIYPFVLVPAGDHWRVGMRYACPSVTANKGRPLSVHNADLRLYAEGLEEQEGIARTVVPAPVLQRGQSAAWPDLLLFTKALVGIVGEEGTPLERRLRKCLALATLCREAKFDKITGPRLREFLEIVAPSLEDDLPDASAVPPPGWIGRVLFRQAVAIYARRDAGPDRGISRRGRLALFWAAWRFAMGSGRVPRVHGLMPATTFEEIEKPAAPLPSASEEMLTRYYRVKLESMQFCGPTNFRRNFWDGLESLVLTFPAIMWLARALHDRPREDAVAQALRIVDDNFGFNPMLGSRRQLFGLRLLASRGELARLVAWYR